MASEIVEMAYIQGLLVIKYGIYATVEEHRRIAAGTP